MGVEEANKTEMKTATEKMKEMENAKTSVEKAKEILNNETQQNLQQFDQALQQLLDKHKLFLQARVIIDGSTINTAVLALPRVE